MTESIRYLSVALQTIRLLQAELIKHLQKASSIALLEFKKSFEHHLNKVRNIELQKSIESDKISTCIGEMDAFLEKSIRLRKTSHSDRLNYRGVLTTQGTDRMGLSGRTFYQSQSNELSPGGLSEIQQITQSYKIKDSARMSAGMKWRMSSPYEATGETMAEKQRRTIDTSSIEMLNEKIPEIQNRIKMLSFNKNSLEMGRESPRGLESRSRQPRRYIPRLF